MVPLSQQNEFNPMFRLRISGDHVISIERTAHNGMYTVTVRVGVTLIHKVRFDTGREAWIAYRSSPERLMSA